MNYGEVKTLFLSILNRRDITPTQVTSFVDMGIRRIQRKLRIPSMEKVIIHTSDGTGIIPVPTDFLEMISMATSDTTTHRKLIKIDLQTVLDYGVTNDYPMYYYRAGSEWFLGPRPYQGTQISINYYRDFSDLTNDTDTNWLTLAAPDLVAYAALTYSSDHFLDDRLQLFESRYSGIIEDLMDQAKLDEAQNASISARSLDYGSAY